MAINRTKIVATLGPSSDSEESVAALIQAGVDLFRINAAHCEPKMISRLIRRVGVGSAVGI